MSEWAVFKSIFHREGCNLYVKAINMINALDFNLVLTTFLQDLNISNERNAQFLIPKLCLTLKPHPGEWGVLQQRPIFPKGGGEFKSANQLIGGNSKISQTGFSTFSILGVSLVRELKRNLTSSWGWIPSVASLVMLMVCKWQPNCAKRDYNLILQFLMFKIM